ncbi:hypothetical protein GSI_07326 [Ganoderma sinense ZZ0214-1]|uniref:Uncharacterized protein n=1 Tax=Ganoderma sinense ZZ0214-1 TaxID=1077348 RepID=A0A2G8SA47_9APHY|nr:hypothetical protein GSI_07326 [Ganoderma sinense ZZ0214-1]
MREWAELHKYALTVLAHAFLRRTGGGVDANLRLGRVVVFHLSTERPANAPPDDNPGVKFTLCNTTLIDAEQAPWFRDHPQLADADFGEPGFCGDAVDMKPAGFLPIVCLAEGSKFVAASYFPMYRAVRHPDDAPREAETVAAFRDITRLFITFINSGVVFRLPSSGHPAPPVAGNMVRMRKGWKWQEIRTTWAVILMGIMMHSEGILVFETTIPVTELWTRFWRW